MSSPAAAYDATPARTEVPARQLELICFVLIVAYAVFLVTCYLRGLWLVTPDGGGAEIDFVNVWAAGKLVLSGHPAAVYDWTAHKAAEVEALGHPFDLYFGWHYPPPLLFAASVLALMPYTIAYAVWMFGTFPAYLIAVRSIIADRFGYLLAAAFPAVLWNFSAGQNGFLSAALLGGALLTLVKRPILSGVLFGLLTYKPHLGLLIPIALLAGRHWRAIIVAEVVAELVAAASWLAFGNNTWAAFFANIGHTSQVVLSQGMADLDKLQTAFGFMHMLGFSTPAAWIAQGAIVLICTVYIAMLWYKTVDADIKAAALGVAALLATPYLHIYDLVVLAVPLAFLLRVGRNGGFLAGELPLMGFACLLVAVTPLFAGTSLGFVSVLIVAALIVRRVFGADTAAVPIFARSTI